MHNIKQNKAMKGGNLKVGSYSNQGGRWWGVDQVRCPWGEMIVSHNGMVWRDKYGIFHDVTVTYCIKVIILSSTLCFWQFKFLIPLSKVMDQDGELNHLRLQFQALQQQQEKRKLDRKKEREANKVITSVTRDNIDVCQTDKHNDR